MNRIVLIVILLVGLVGCDSSVTPPPILVGHVSDKTRLDKAGDQAELGIRLALAEWSKDNKLDGRAIQVRHTDARGEIAAFESQAVRLTSVNRCITLFGGLSAAEVTALDHAQVPLVTFYGQPVAGASSQVFYLGMAPARQGEVLAKFAAEAKTLQPVLVIDERRPEATVVAEAFQKAITPVAVLSLRFGKDAKWDELVKSVLAQKPTVVVFAGGVRDFNAFRKAGLPPTVEVIYAGDDGQHRLFDPDANAKASVVLATAFHADPAAEKITAFMKAYQDAFQKDADVHAALAYDGFRLLVEAMKTAQPQMTLERLREELQKTKDFAGLTGPLTITANRQTERPLHVVRWQKGVLSRIKTIAPDAEKKEKS